jgi:uncharacterized repeat protein (TIGR01451 family)
MRSSRRSVKARRAGRTRLVVISAMAAFSLVLGQAIVAAAGTASDPRGRDDGTTSDTTVVEKAGGSSESNDSTAPRSALSTNVAAPAPLAGSSSVQLKFFGQDPTTYDHGTGVGGNSSDATETELEAEDFQCGDKVAFYLLLQAPGGLAGSNTISASLDFSKHTSSSEPFGFSSGVSFALEGGGVTTSDGGESLAGSGGFGSTANDITLAFQVSDVEANEVIAVRVLVVLGNCGPGQFTGNVASAVSSCSPAAITTCGNQTVTLKFKGTLGTIRVVKDLNPSTDPGTFNLRIGGTTYATGGDGADTGALGFLAGTYTVDETAGSASTSLGDYTTTISCQNGAQPAIVTNGTSTDVNLANGDTWVCTISNTVKPPAAPQLTIIKTVVNDDGGTAVSHDFTMQVTATNPSNNNFPGADTPGVTITLDPGAYSVGESGPGGYAASFSADCTGSVVAGDHKTCTITNDDVAPQLIVIKHVVNNSGTGTSVAGDFTMNVTGTNPNPANFAGAEAPGTSVDLDAGAYDVTETGPGGYAASFSADCTGSIAVGETKTCTITNDDVAAVAPQLTIIKTVVNNNGGTAVSKDFTMQVTATNPSNNNFAGADTPGVTITLDPGAYSVAETGPKGYAASFSPDCTGSIAAGQHKTCTITNDDVAPAPPPPANAPGIVIVKGGPAFAHVGDTITYTFAVELGAGSPPLSNVTVVDPICNSAPVLGSQTGGDLDGTLESGETWSYSCPHLVTATDPDPLPNTATASGTAANGTTVSDQDSHVVDLIHPAINIAKSAKPQTGSPGDTIVYTYKVTNVGDVDLVNISVDDNVIGHVCDIPLLHPKDSVTCTASFVIPANANIKIDNIGVAVGQDELGVPVRDEDTARITVVLGVTITPNPPGGVAFTGSAAVVPLTALALMLLLVGSGLLWAGRKRDRRAPGPDGV